MENLVLKFISLVILCQSLLGCTTFTSPLQKTSALNDNMGYVYGRFDLDAQKFLLGGHLKSGIGITEKQSSGEYLIEFSPDDSISIIEVKPGLYNLSKFVFAYAGGGSGGEKPITSPYLKESFYVKAGKAYYIGDYEGSSGKTYGSFHWSVDSFRNNFDETTNDLKQVFPNFEWGQFDSAI